MDGTFSAKNMEVSTDNLKGLQQNILDIKEKLKHKVVDIKIDVIYFIVTSVVFMIFISIIFMDMFNNIKLYFNRNKLVNRKTTTLQTDDNTYPDEVFVQRNDLNKLEERIMTHGGRQKEKLQPLIDLKVANNIPNANNIVSQISINVLDPKLDDNTYTKNNGDSFWKMLFMPPKYYELVNNRAEPYFKLHTEANI